MKVKFGVIPLVLITFIVAGCSSMSGFPERSDEVKKRLKNLQDKYFLTGVNETDVLDEYSGKPDDEKRAYRDEVILARMMALDLQFSVFREAIYKEGIGSNLAIDILGVGVGVAGAAFTGATTSRIMSALSGGIAGTGTAINENLFFKQTMPALMALMEAEREKIKAQIYTALTLDFDKYPLGRGMVDLERYYYAGSIPGAIGSITKTAGVEKDKAEKELARVQKLSVDLDRALIAQDEVDKLASGVAFQIIQSKPTELTSEAQNLIQGRLGETLENATEKLRNDDPLSRLVLKQILILLADYSSSTDDLAKWEAAIKGQQ